MNLCEYTATYDNTQRYAHMWILHKCMALQCFLHYQCTTLLYAILSVLGAKKQRLTAHLVYCTVQIMLWSISLSAPIFQINYRVHPLKISAEHMYQPVVLAGQAGKQWHT